MHWIIFSLGLCGVSFLLFLINTITRDILDISKLFSLIWGINIIANITLLQGTIRVSNNTLIIIIMTWWLFLFGYLLVIKKHTNEVKIFFNSKAALILLYVTFTLHMVSFFMQAKYLNTLSFININYLINDLASLRNSQAFNQDVLPLYLEPFRSGYIYYIPLAFLLLRHKMISTNKVIVICSSALLMSVVAFTRAPILSTVITIYSCLFILFSKKRKQLLLYGVVMVFSIISIFIIMQSSLIDRQNSNISFQQMIAPYLGSSLNGYEYIINGGYIKAQNGLYSFDNINYILEKMNVINDYPSLVREYTFYPIITNVYTYLDVYTLDFGILGSLIGSLSFGLICGYFYNKKNRGTYFGLSSYVVILYYITMIGLNNEIIRFSFLLILVILYIINFFVSKRIVIKK